ncbi:hypothetical protein C8J57DRAFT_1294445 [Mycena rebaudengoi]|nr:hypothetical protein C8J57DRAFT_1294445 [Mycena rebaudengoi]
MRTCAGYVCSNCTAAPPPSKQKTLKLCGTCKLTRYCSRECQAAHWKQHKPSCRIGGGDLMRNVPAEYRAQTLAERLMHVPWLMILIDMYAVVALRLDVDSSNAARTVLQVRIFTKPVSDAPDCKIVMLQIERFVTQPVSVLTETMRLTLRSRPTMPWGGDKPPLLLYFSTDGDNYLFMPHDVMPRLVEHAAMRPVFDDGREITEENVIS